jgi:hypothetical protein
MPSGIKMSGGDGRKSSLNPSDHIIKGGWYPISVQMEPRFQAAVTGASGTVDISATKVLHIREAASQVKFVYLTSAFVEGFTSTGRVRAGMAASFKNRYARLSLNLSMVGGTATSGNFRIAYTDSTINRTTTINHNATVAQVQAALDTLMSAVSSQTFATVTATVTGSDFPAGTMNIVLNSTDPLHNILGLQVVNNSVVGATPTFAINTAAFTDLQFPSVDSGPVTAYPNWGYNEGMIVSYPASTSVAAGDRLRVDMVWLGYERTTIAGITNTNTRFPSQNGFANRYPATKQFNGRFTIDALTTGNDIIAGTGTPSAISFGAGGGTIAPAMILGQLSGLTRRPNVLLYANSIIGTVQNVVTKLECMGYNVESWGHSGSAPREAMDDPEFRYLASKCDAWIWAGSENLINPQALDSSSYFGGSTETNTERLVKELWDLANEIGKPFFVVPPYLMGLNAADMTNQQLTKTNDETAYGRCLDFRTRVADKIAADPRNGVLLDVYGRIIVDGSDQGLDKRYLYHSLPNSKNGIAFWRLDTDNVSGDEPTDTNVFAWRCGTFTGSAGNGNFRGWRRDGGDNTQGLPFAKRHSARQEECFGPSSPDHNAGISFVAQATFNGTRLVCYKGGGGSPVAVGQTAHIRTLTAGGGMFLNGNNQTFRLDEAPTAGTTYSNSWWAMDFVVDSVNLPYSNFPLTDSNGSPSATTGLHLNVGVVSALWYLELEKTFHPLMQSMKREE